MSPPEDDDQTYGSVSSPTLKFNLLTTGQLHNWTCTVVYTWWKTDVPNWCVQSKKCCMFGYTVWTECFVL